MRRRNSWLLCAASCLVQPVSADDTGMYLSAGLGYVYTGNNVKLTLPDLPAMTGETDSTDPAWSATVGYRFNRNISLEFGYVDLDELSSDVADEAGNTDTQAALKFSADGVTVALLGTFPIGSWEPYIKAGVLFSNTALEFSGRAATSPFGARLTEHSEDALFGLGVRYALNEHLQLYIDSTYFMEVGEPGTGVANFTNTSLGLLLRF
jgi:Outer membrane protein beta-barrel domain